MTGRIEKISLEWFLTEPALFMVMCSHNIVANTDMNCPMRSGQRRIEYNPILCKDMTEEGRVHTHSSQTSLFTTACRLFATSHCGRKQLRG